LAIYWGGGGEGKRGRGGRKGMYEKKKRRRGK